MFRSTEYGVRRTVFYLVLFFLFSGAGCYATPTQEISSTEKEVAQDPNTWDFGQVKQGEVLSHDFVLKNETKEVLNIKETNTSCGCTVSGVKNKTLLPDEETAIEVKFNSKGYLGPVKQYIYVQTDNLDNPIIRYIIKADVVKESARP